MTEEENKKLHDLKFELRQQRLRCDKMEQELEALKKMMTAQIIFTNEFAHAYNGLLDALDRKEEKK